MKTLIIIFFSLFSTIITAQDLAAYRLYNAKGKKTSFKKMLKQAQKADVVLFGELHNNPISHWLQLELATELQQKTKLNLGFEMLERDNQQVVNDYLAGKIDQKQMDSLARLWENYKTDYKPLVDLAKKEHLDVCACNVPRYLANKVYKEGFSALDHATAQQKQWMAPLPIPYDASLKTYVEMMQMMGGHSGENLPKAQAIKDATMAHFIIQSLQKKHVMLHFNGAYHSNDYEGIVWYLKKYKPELKVMTITTESVPNAGKFNKDLLQKADFIIQVDEQMTNTF